MALTSTFPRWAGDRIPRFVFDLCVRLSDRFDVTVLAPHCPGTADREYMGGMTVIRFRYAPGRWEVLAYGGGMLAGAKANPFRYLLVPLFLLGGTLALLRTLREQRVDLIHAHWLIPQGLMAGMARLASSNSTPLLCTMHGADLFALRGRFFNWLKRLIMTRADALTVVSTAMVAAVAQIDAEAASRTRVISMGADTRKRFLPSPQPRDDATLLFVGRLTEKKGLSVLLEALPDILSKRADLKLRIAGDGPEREALGHLAQRLGVDRHVDWLGSLSHEELVTEYRRATMTVFPSIVATGGDQEGLGLVLLEALACECPVVASDLPAVADVITNEVTGLLAHPADGAHLAEQVHRLLADRSLQRRLALLGRSHVQRNFDWDVIAAKYASLIDSMMPQLDGANLEEDNEAHYREEQHE